MRSGLRDQRYGCGEELHRCYAPEVEDESYGPPLAGIIGRTTGTCEFQEHSSAMEQSGLMWATAPLRVWTEDN